MSKPVCFVVQGFGPKTDFTDGRELNLDASYSVIKDAIVAAGCRCVRADEIVHAGTIDIPMYQQLLHADLVIADLSTYNVNAAFELGVRYALRPRTTIVVAEQKFKSPFDVNHIVIRRYEHLGKDLGAQEAKRFKKELVTLIKALLAGDQNDSPVYAMLPRLQPPIEQPAAPAAPGSTADKASRSLAGRAIAKPPVRAPRSGRNPTSTPAPRPTQRSAADWYQSATAAMDQENWREATAAWQALHKLAPSDTRAVQQLALATYRSEKPSPRKALARAHDILLTLSPSSTNDPETLGLWGAVHKRLWLANHQLDHLSAAITACFRGFSLKQDHYNGINLAHMLTLRALEHARAGRRDEAVTDRVQAERVWREVQRIGEAGGRQTASGDADHYWVAASQWEAAIGLGDKAAERRWGQVADRAKVALWMQTTRHQQAERLRTAKAELTQRLNSDATSTPPSTAASAPAKRSSERSVRGGLRAPGS